MLAILSSCRDALRKIVRIGRIVCEGPFWATAPSRRRFDASAAAEAESNSAETQRSVLFYHSIDSVTAEQHGELCLAEDIDYWFTSETSYLLLNGIEFSVAARHYQIIFNSEPGGSPLGVVGVCTNENLFVEADNTWSNIAEVQGEIRCPRGSQEYGFTDREP